MKEEIDEVVLDIESDGLLFDSTLIWTICATHIQSGEKLKVNPFKDEQAKQKLVEFISQYEKPRLIAHFGLGYDFLMFMFILGIEITVGPDKFNNQDVQYVDSFYLSMFLNPDRPGHSIEYFGEQEGLEKIDWRSKAIELGLIQASDPEAQEFKQWHPEMDVYCERDVEVNIKAYKSLKNEWLEVYGSEFEITDAYKCGQKSFFLMSCQELTGWKFDQKFAHDLAEKIVVMMEEIRAEVEPKLPPRALKKSEEKFYTMPAKPYKKDGSFSSSWEKFVEKHDGKESFGQWEFYGKTYEVEPGQILDIKLPMEMGNQDQMKDWFLSLGWKPTLWNYQKDKNGKPMRDQRGKLIPTSPKIQETQKLCVNLEAMQGDIIKQVVKWLSLRNRQSVLNTWINNPRLQMDGRIGAGRTGIASTHRQKHRTIVNCPKASPKVLLGYEFRSLWIAEEGMLIAAADAAALEGRVQGHYTFPYDDGETARELLSGDVHSKTAKSVYEDQLLDFDITSEDFNKDDPKFKPFRDRSKNVYYAAMYGAGPPKIASTAGLPESRGQEISEKFWAANQGTKLLKDKLEKYWETKGKKKHLPAIDGRILITRKKSALLNTIFQSAGGIAMDYALCFMDMWLGGLKWKDRKPYYSYKGYIVRRVCYQHDEAEFECDEEVAQEIGNMVTKAIEKSGQYLKFKVELKGESKIGKNWCETH